MTPSDAIAELKEQDRKKQITKIYRLAGRSLVIAAILALAMPIVGYAYTRRWVPLLVFLLSAGVFGMLFNGPPNLLAMLLGGALAAADNVIAIHKARIHLLD